VWPKTTLWTLSRRYAPAVHISDPSVSMRYFHCSGWPWPSGHFKVHQRSIELPESQTYHTGLQLQQYGSSMEPALLLEINLMMKSKYLVRGYQVWCWAKVLHNESNWNFLTWSFETLDSFSSEKYQLLSPIWFQTFLRLYFVSRSLRRLLSWKCRRRWKQSPRLTPKEFWEFDASTKLYFKITLFSVVEFHHPVTSVSVRRATVLSRDNSYVQSENCFKLVSKPIELERMAKTDLVQFWRL